MNSMAQQAVPKGMGQSDPPRAQLTTPLTVVVKKLSPILESTAILYPLSKRPSRRRATVHGDVGNNEESSIKILSPARVRVKQRPFCEPQVSQTTGRNARYIRWVSAPERKQ